MTAKINIVNPWQRTETVRLFTFTRRMTDRAGFELIVLAAKFAKALAVDSKDIETCRAYRFISEQLYTYAISILEEEKQEVM